MDVVEPYLLQLGFLERTSRGRVASANAYAHLGLPVPDDESRNGPRGGQRSLFDPGSGE